MLRDKPVVRSRPAELAFGSPVSFTLEATDADPEGQALYKVFSFRGRKGQRLAATVLPSDSAERTDPVILQLHRTPVMNAAEQPIARGSFSQKNSKILATLPEDGDYFLYTVQLSSLTGKTYSLNASIGEVSTPLPKRLVIGDNPDSFVDSDPQATGAFGELPGRLVHTWTLSVRRGQKLQMEICATTPIHPIIYVVAPTIVGDRVVYRSSEARETLPCGDSKNARLELTVAASGALRVLASPARNAAGDYRILVRQLSEPETIAPQASDDASSIP